MINAGPRDMARLFSRLTTEGLGYDRYVAQGGDRGGAISSWLGFEHAPACRAIHINIMTMRYPDGPRGAAAPSRNGVVLSCLLHTCRIWKVRARIRTETRMSGRKRTKFVHEGGYVAEVDVELLEPIDGWSPCLSLEDAYRLDEVRQALRRGDVNAAARHSRVFSLTPVAV